MRLSIVIPTLNAGARLQATLAALAPSESDRNEIAADIIVSDGGSIDGTVAAARAAGARVMTAPKGRGSQMAAGARAASGGWLLFLHADTRLGDGWRQAVAEFARDPANGDRAGYFRFALDDDHPMARRLERMVAWRCRALALPFGDQGLLLSRAFYERLGGFRDWPLMEDVEFARRIGRARLVPLAVEAVTSAERFRRAGYLRQSLRNAVWLLLYFAGVSPQFLAKLYK